MSTRRLDGQGSLLVIFYVVVLVAAIIGTYYWQQKKITVLNQQKQSLEQQLATKTPATSTSKSASFEFKSSKNVAVLVYTPSAKSTVTSPVIVLGQVPGNWSFEAQFPIKLKDQNGKIIGQATAHLQGDWMTDKLVPFTATITATLPSGQKGTLVLQKDNPSGLATNDDSVEIEVAF